MKLIVLDGYSINPGDISWKPIEDIGELMVYERSNKFEVIERTKNVHLCQ